MAGERESSWGDLIFVQSEGHADSIRAHESVRKGHVVVSQVDWWLLLCYRDVATSYAYQDMAQEHSRMSLHNSCILWESCEISFSLQRGWPPFNYTWCNMSTTRPLLVSWSMEGLCETCDFECAPSDSPTSPSVYSTLSRNIAEIQTQMERSGDSETHLSSWTFNITKLSVPIIKMHH